MSVTIQVTMELLSDAIFGSGYSVPGGEDVAVCRDERGYPYFKGQHPEGTAAGEPGEPGGLDRAGHRGRGRHAGPVRLGWHRGGPPGPLHRPDPGAAPGGPGGLLLHQDLYQLRGGRGEDRLSAHGGLHPPGAALLRPADLRRRGRGFAAGRPGGRQVGGHPAQPGLAGCGSGECGWLSPRGSAPR